MKKRILIDVEDHDVVSFIAKWNETTIKPYIEGLVKKDLREQINNNKHFKDYYEVKSSNFGRIGDDTEPKTDS